MIKTAILDCQTCDSEKKKKKKHFTTNQTLEKINNDIDINTLRFKFQNLFQIMFQNPFQIYVNVYVSNCVSKSV